MCIGPAVTLAGVFLGAQGGCGNFEPQVTDSGAAIQHSRMPERSMPYAPLAPTFAIVDLQAAASAGPAGVTQTGYVSVRAITPDCRGQRRVEFSFGHVSGANLVLPDEPAVAASRAEVCVAVAVDDSLRGVIGRRIPLARMNIGELASGEQYTSADPADLQAAGVSIYLGSSKGGYLAGVFTTAGFLERPDGADRRPRAAVAVAVQRVGAPLPDQRYLVTLMSPDATPVNFSVIAPVMRLREWANERPLAPLSERLDAPIYVDGDSPEPPGT